MKLEFLLLALLLKDLGNTARKMSILYSLYPNLNDEADISKIIPMSLDEWAAEIASTNILPD